MSFRAQSRSGIFGIVIFVYLCIRYFVLIISFLLVFSSCNRKFLKEVNLQEKSWTMASYYRTNEICLNVEQSEIDLYKSQLILDSIQEFLLRAKDKKIEIGCHVLTRSKKHSKRQAKKFVEDIRCYFASIGINTNRIVFKGYGKLYVSIFYTHELDMEYQVNRNNKQIVLFTIRELR